MTNTCKQNPGILLRRGIAFTLLALSAGCASPPPQSAYQLDNAGHPVKNSQGVCVQIGPLTSADLKGACYQLVQSELNQHVEPLPLDEFGYLFPPLKPETRPVPVTVPASSLIAAATSAQPLPIQTPTVPAIPLVAHPPAAAALAPPAATTPSPHYVGKTVILGVWIKRVVDFSTQMPFRLNRAYLSHKNRLALTAFVNSLEQYRGVIGIRITGHTDKSGPARFNHWLSVMRAKSAQRWLLSLGVDPRTVTIQGVGSSEPRPHARRAADNRYVSIEVAVRVPAR